MPKSWLAQVQLLQPVLLVVLFASASFLGEPGCSHLHDWLLVSGKVILRASFLLSTYCEFVLHRSTFVCGVHGSLDPPAWTLAGLKWL